MHSNCAPDSLSEMGQPTSPLRQCPGLRIEDARARPGTIQKAQEKPQRSRELRVPPRTPVRAGEELLHQTTGGQLCLGPRKAPVPELRALASCLSSAPGPALILAWSLPGPPPLGHALLPCHLPLHLAELQPWGTDTLHTRNQGPPWGAWVHLCWSLLSAPTWVTISGFSLLASNASPSPPSPSAWNRMLSLPASPLHLPRPHSHPLCHCG